MKEFRFLKNDTCVYAVNYIDALFVIKTYSIDDRRGLRYIIEFELPSYSAELVNNIAHMLDDNISISIDEYKLFLGLSDADFKTCYLSYYSSIKDKKLTSPVLYVEVIKYDTPTEK